MTIHLKFNLQANDDETANLTVGFQAENFAGLGSAWIALSQLKTFAETLGKYPLNPISLPVLEGGFWDDEGKRISQEHLHISVKPHGELGALEFVVRLAVQDEESIEPGLKHSASANIRTDYSQLVKISSDLKALVEDRHGEVSFVFE